MIFVDLLEALTLVIGYASHFFSYLMKLNAAILNRQPAIHLGYLSLIPIISLERYP